MEVRFYEPKDWNRLSAGQRNFVRQEKLKLKAEKQAAVKMVSTVASLQASIQELTSRLNSNGKRQRGTGDDTSTTESESSSDSPSRKKVAFHTQRRG